MDTDDKKPTPEPDGADGTQGPERDLAHHAGATVQEAVMEISRRRAALPDLDVRTADSILNYDEIGLPR